MELLSQESIKYDANFFSMMRINPAMYTSTSLWVEMIHDLVNGAGYSYSRIAYRAGVSPTSIQKLATIPNRIPRQRNWLNLIKVYYHAFYRKGAELSAKNYIKHKTNNRLKWVANIPVDIWSSFEKPRAPKWPGKLKASTNSFGHCFHCHYCAKAIFTN